jgi:hypothetical protein
LLNLNFLNLNLIFHLKNDLYLKISVKAKIKYPKSILKSVKIITNKVLFSINKLFNKSKLKKVKITLPQAKTLIKQLRKP